MNKTCTDGLVSGGFFSSRLSGSRKRAVWSAPANSYVHISYCSVRRQGRLCITRRKVFARLPEGFPFLRLFVVHVYFCCFFVRTAVSSLPTVTTSSFAWNPIEVDVSSTRFASGNREINVHGKRPCSVAYRFDNGAAVIIIRYATRNDATTAVRGTCCSNLTWL